MMRRLMLTVALMVACLATADAATYYVDGRAEDASDENAGTEGEPWETMARAGAAEELKPGDTVLVADGVYRESVHITVSGEEGNPITFAAAPGARVVIKGSEIVRGDWERVSDLPDMEEPFPNAFTGLWRVTLGDEYFTDPDFEHSYTDVAKRWVSQVYLQDRMRLQQIGPDRIYTSEEYVRLVTVGRGIEDMIDGSFYFDAAEQMLYMKQGGSPSWYTIEMGVRGWVLKAVDVHDVVIRGFEMRHNRQPGGSWPMVNIGNCARVVVEDCEITRADFCGLGVGTSTDCIVRNCDLSYNGNTGLGMSKNEGVLIDGCRLMFNNTRRFRSGWHAGGMKCIPANKNCIVRNCEAAYNIASDGIWFDADNEGILIEGNVSHHNDGCGIFFEINKGGGTIANNLCYSNGVRGIYISGSQKTWVVHNTVVENLSGIVAMPRGDDWPLEDVHLLNNLLIRNWADPVTSWSGNDLTVFMGAEGEPPGERTVTSNHSDYNVFAERPGGMYVRHHWNPNNTLEQWRERFGEDMNSRIMPVEYRLPGMGFELLTTEGLDTAGPIPEAAGWQPKEPGRAGCELTKW